MTNPRFLQTAERWKNPEVPEEKVGTQLPRDYAVQNLEGFIYIPSTKLYVAKERTHFGKNWDKAHELLASENFSMQTLPEFVEFMKHIRTNDLDVYNEITQVRNSWRAEWIDAYFEEREDGLYVLTKNKAKSEKLDKNTLRKKKGISLDSWIKDPTSQGLPRRNVAKGNLNFYPSINNSVAGFLADDGGAGLDCGRSLGSWNSLIWVRAVRRESDVLLADRK